MLEAVEVGLAVIQGSQDAEGDSQDHPIKGGRLFPAGCGEGQRGTAVAVVDDGRHAPIELDGPGGQTVSNGCGQLLVPTDNVVALIGFAEDAKIAWVHLKAEQIDQIQGTLFFRLAAILLVIGDIEELSHTGVVASGDILLDPIIEAEVVKLVSGGCVAVVEGGERRVLYLAPQHMIHLREVTICGLLQVVLIEEEIGVLGTHRLGLQKINGL